MIDEINRFISRRIDLAYRGDSSMYAVMNFFRVPGFRNEEVNANSCSRETLYDLKNVDWDFDWPNVTGGFGICLVWVSMKINHLII